MTKKSILNLYNKRADAELTVERTWDFYNPETNKKNKEWYVTHSLNGREVLSFYSKVSKKKTLELLYKLCDKFDFWFYLEFSSYEECEEFVNTL